MPRIETVKYKFVVKEGQASTNGADDAPISLACELLETPELPILGGGSLRVLLSRDTTMEQAHDLARLMQRHVDGIRYQGP